VLFRSTDANNTVNVYDYVNPGAPKKGNIWKFQIETSYSWLGFDAYAYSTSRQDPDVFTKAPFSHNAESVPGTPVPEPTTMVLFGLGAAGLGIVRRFKN
jgi:hypothetical protein